ncbi:cysteine-rich secretory protein family domain-containing protein [Ditylenchus destructor]|uniref:Cysteine-rich secretory protein family domain-containing protein n=1 Tax=Ditylenchus destructor TaxID=166010 RepID=A0AAD4RD56_9BILA|nr:cysteine-rich secretory protein family domain-containing protein [Ditylenchus destructor]
MLIILRKIIFMLVLGIIAIAPVIALSSSEKQIAVNTHNQYRSQLAKGQVLNRGAELLPSGSNIYKLSYSDTLEQAAQAWADNCEFKHSEDQLAQTGQGQNLYEIDTQQDTSSALTSAADMWWNEVVEVGINSDLIIRSSMFGDENNQIGHFTAMAWGDTTQIGCGVSYCASQGFTLLVCNYYKSGNVIGRPIYESGSQCQSASDVRLIPDLIVICQWVYALHLMETQLLNLVITRTVPDREITID